MLTEYEDSKMTISRCYGNAATHEPQVCELCVGFQKFSGMGDHATSIYYKRKQYTYSL